MKRARALVEFTRRDFCAFAACAAGAAAVASCTSDGPGAVQTGGLNGSDDEAPADASSLAPHDAATGSGSGSSGATCPTTGATDVGAPASFVLNTPVYVSAKKLFIVRDSGGLYAMTAACTHEGATTEVQGSDIYCPRHGALFTFAGAVISGPTNKALAHYAMCTLANGHVGVVTTMTVSASQRLVA